MTNSISYPTVVVDSALTDILHHPIARHTKTRGRLLLSLLRAHKPIFNSAGKRPLAILILQMVAPVYPYEIYVEGKAIGEKEGCRIRTHDLDGHHSALDSR